MKVLIKNIGLCTEDRGEPLNDLKLQCYNP